MEAGVGVGPNGGNEVGLGVGIGGIISETQRPPVQLDLLPSAPPLRALHSHLSLSTCFTEYGNGKCCDGEVRSSVSVSPRGFDVNRKLKYSTGIDDDAHAVVSSPNSTVSSFQMGMDFSVYQGGRGRGRGRGSMKSSDEDEAGTARKKLRLSKEQSAYLEESFKEHNTLNPKQKLALARQLNLRPRQVEVWFQNRRARTKLKQTEVDCEYLKRCCETLTEENRRMQKEIQELRALKVAHPFYMHLPTTTLTICPSCERVATTTTTTTNDDENHPKSFSSTIAQPQPRFYPFPQFPPPQ
ncbi:homeobox-leucine zipper protein HOX11 [Cryptomeria japonica]|uniref:homeobox-leucine zipper protein HOX11 n=1 Tax=Cryptomeria japonica TaxID=3369 RepID=UPI0025AC30DC|nr:homeobox-leucine zipper protein HOX11 [Cryptomeria japonica]